MSGGGCCACHERDIEKRQRQTGHGEKEVVPGLLKRSTRLRQQAHHVQLPVLRLRRGAGADRARLRL